MPDEIYKCANPKCGHVHRESEQVLVKTPNPLVSDCVCPRCGFAEWFYASPKDIARVKATKSARMEAACAAE